MKQAFTAINRSDETGAPAGGTVRGKGLAIDWQEGPLAVDGVRTEPNGCFVETVLEAAIVRLDYYQSTRFACDENAEAVEHVRAAVRALESRTQRRTVGGVEGSHGLVEGDAGFRLT